MGHVTSPSQQLQDERPRVQHSFLVQTPSRRGRRGTRRDEGLAQTWSGGVRLSYPPGRPSLPCRGGNQAAPLPATLLVSAVLRAGGEQPAGTVNRSHPVGEEDPARPRLA